MEIRNREAKIRVVAPIVRRKDKVLFFVEEISQKDLVLQ